MTLAKLNATLKKAYKRADELEAELAAVVEPILARAGETAARQFADTTIDYLVAAGRRHDALAAAAYTADSTMVALYPRPHEAEALALEGGEPADILHCTLCFMGQVPEEDLPGMLDVVRQVAGQHAPLVGTVGGVARFGVSPSSDGLAPAVLLPDVPGLVELRVHVTEALVAAGYDFSREHGYTPHLTLAYLDPEEAMEVGGYALGEPLHFDELVLTRGDVPTGIPLVGVRPMTAAGEAKKNPGWAKPLPNEVVDVASLVATLTKKTSPVRLAVIETLVADALAAVGIEFDITNPFVAKVLAQSASQITHIAETTQLNVMRIISAAYDEGLSIPDTAKAIRIGMAEASPARATLIARTELAGAVNGGSLAAAQIYAEDSGTGLYKQWLTGDGAVYPRHEDYPDLDGQTVPLDGYFRVGEADLQFPGDPSGPPGEVCNCRCALIYVNEPAESASGDQ